MKNNKLLKRFLMSTALGAISLSAVSDAMAVNQNELDGITTTNPVDLGAGAPTAANSTLNLGTANGANGGGSFEGIVYGNLDLNSISGVTFNVGSMASAKDSANGAVFQFDSIINTGNAANTTVSFNAANNTQLVFTGTTSKLINKLTGNDKNFKVTFGNTSTVAEVSGANTTIIANGVNANVTITNFGAAGIKTFKTDGDKAATLTIDGQSKALGTAAGEGYVATNGQIIIKKNSDGRYEATSKDSKIVFDAKDNGITATGNATLKDADSKLIFTRSAGGAAGARDITFIGKVSGNAAANGIMLAHSQGGVLNVTIEEEITNLNQILVVSAGNPANATTLTLKTNSKATTYEYDSKSTLVLDATDDDVKHKGAFTGNGADSILKTTGDKSVTIDGAVAKCAFVVGADTTVTGAIGNGNGNVVAIKFDKDFKGGSLKAQTGIASSSTVDFAKTASTLEISGADSVLGAITNVSGSTIKMTSNHNLTLGTAGAAGELLNIDANKITTNTNAVTVADKSFFDVIDTGAGRLAYSADSEIYANEIKGGSIYVNAADLTIKANGDNKIAINSKKVEFNGDKTLTIDGDFTDFNANVSTANNNEGKLTFTGSGTIKSSNIGANAAAIAQLGIGADKKNSYS